MIDRELVTRKMALITRDLNAVAPFAAKSLDAYLASATDEVLVERWLERMIGRMIDINYHLITESGQPPPRDYYESFIQLAPCGVLIPEFASRLAACAGLRNRIVHEYDEIDPERIYAALRVAVEEIPEYLRQVLRYLERLRVAE